MKKFSIYLLFGVFVALGFAAVEYYSNRANWTKIYEKIYRGNEIRLADEAYVAKTYLETFKDMDFVIKHLEHRRGTIRTIDYWVIFHKREIYKFGNSTSANDILEFQFFPYKEGTILQKLQHSYTVMNLGDEFTLVLGLRYLPESYIGKTYEEYFDMIVLYQVSILFIAFAVFAYLFRDIRASIGRLLSRGNRSFTESKPHSREADLLARGFEAYHRQNEQLERERDLLSWQVLPSLRTELKSGRTPPYDFSCTLVRTDINGFSKIFHEHPIEEFTATINDFFTDVSHIVARYGGLIHEFVGDEVIFYFKDEDCRFRKDEPGNSIATALSAIRDIGRAAEKYHAITSGQRGYPFTVKSSLAHGRLRFGRLVNGYSLAGAILIETVRILSHVDEKSENTVTFAYRHVESVSKIADTKADKRVHLKGFQNEVDLCSYLGHRPLEKLLKSRTDDFDFASFYRGDDDVLQILEFAREQSRRRNWVLAGKAIGLLRRFRLTRSDGRAQAELADWLESAIMLAHDPNASKHSLKILASAVKIAENLVPREAFDAKMDALINEAIKVPDRRVAANALDVLTYFRGETQTELTVNLSGHTDNRIAANALVFEGQRGLSPAVVRKLRNLLESAEPARTASALFAIGELAAFHRASDVVYYSTKLDFIELVNDIPGYFGHDDEMVRRQAKLAAQKSAVVSAMKAKSKAA